MDDVWKIAKEAGQTVRPINKSGISALIKITSSCRSRCGYCLSWQTQEDALPLDLVVSIIEDVKKFAAYRIVLSGGEPTSHPDFHRIIEACSATSGSVGVITDGQYSPDSSWVSMVDELTFSIDTICPDTYQRIRGINGLSRAVENLDVAVEKDISVSVNIVLSRQAILGLEETVGFFKDRGVSKIHFLPLETHVAQREDLTPSVEDIKQFEEDTLPILQKMHPELISSIGARYQPVLADGSENFSCLIPWIQMTIRPNGDVFPCCRIGDDVPEGNEASYCLGNVKRESIRAIWGSLRRAHVQSSIAIVPPLPCRQCEIGKLFKNKDEVWSQIESIRM